MEFASEELEQIFERLLKFSQSVVEGIEASRASDFSGMENLLTELDEAEPSRAEFDELLSTLSRASASGMNHLHPGFLAYIPIAGANVSAVADYLAALLNRYVGVQWASPAMAQLEWNALRWVSHIFGYPEEARGVFTSGGSIANFTALVTARRAVLGSSHAQGRVYLSDQAHLSVERAARIAGLQPDCLVTVPRDSNLRMDVSALEEILDSDDSPPPFLIVASAGTTNTGAVDPINEIVEVAKPRGIWVHVDGAYGGAFVLTEFGRQALRGIEDADSITMDPHKGMFLSMGLGCVLVRDGVHMRTAHLGEAEYLQTADEDKGVPNMSDYSLELTRPFRGIRLWLALKLFGWEPFRDALDRNRQLAVSLYESIGDGGRFEVPWYPDLTTVCFRLNGRNDSENERLLAEINKRGRVLLSSTKIDGRTYLRACFLSHRSSEETLEHARADIQSAADAL